MRKHYPTAERKYKWLSNLLDTFAIADEGVAATRDHQAASGTPVACSNGCSACCKNPTVPITEPELIGISWYASEVLAGETRARVKERLETHMDRVECPFLIDDQCSIYPVRPLICRQYMVRSKPCSVGEHVDKTRPGDMVMPPRSSIQKVAVQLLNHWDFQSRKAKLQAFENGFIGKHARDMHLYDWRQIANTMAIFDASPGEKVAE